MSTQLLGTGVDGTTPCALLSLADGSRLLLNASEGLQRLASEHRLRLHRGLDAVLLHELNLLGLPRCVHNTRPRCWEGEGLRWAGVRLRLR